MNDINAALALGVSGEGVPDVSTPTAGNVAIEAEGGGAVHRGGQDSSPHSLPTTTSGGETPPTDQERVSIPSPNPSSFGGDRDTTPRENEVLVGGL